MTGMSFLAGPLSLKKKYCMGDEFTDVNIVYTTLNSNILNTSCYG